MNNHISRRQALKIGIGSLVLSNIGCSLFQTRDYEDPKLTYLSPQDLAAIFEEYGITPIIQDNNSNRTLLQIGEEHTKNGDKYVAFFRNLGHRVAFDKVFMEGVYSFHRDPDPYTAYHRGDTLSVGGDFSDEDYRELKEKDSHGYFRLSRKYDVMGIEPDNHDFHILFKIFIISGVELYPLSGPNQGKKNAKAEAEINELASRLKEAELPFSDLPEWASLEEKHKIWKDLQNECYKACYKKRNRYFSRLINTNLGPFETGALIIGKGHTFQTEHSETLERYFAEIGIDAVLLSLEQVIVFNNHFTSED